MAGDQNIVGKKIRKLRYERNWTQKTLAARCEVYGIEMSRATLSKIEAQLRCVTDKEILIFAKALRIKPGDLF